MKLISLNIWGGHILAPLLSFIETYREVDIFCFQEVYHNALHKISTEDRTHHLTIFSDIQRLLPEHQGFFRPAVEGIYGLAMFVKKSVEVVQEGEVLVHENPNYVGSGPSHSRNLHWLECRVDQKTYAILNVHGLWNGQGKGDSPDRILQSQRIKRFMDSFTLPKILCGDFNLKPGTESFQILEEGLNNLITQYGITSTRTSYYPKEEKFADYMLCSEDIRVNTFKVLPEEVSDHAALWLDFE